MASIDNFQWQNNPYAWPLFIAGSVCVYVAWLAWRRRNVYGAVPLVLLMVSVAAWALAYAFELSTPNFEVQFLMTRLEYIGVAGVPVFWWVFVLQYTRQDKWQSQLRPGLLWLVVSVAALTQLAVWTNPWHHLMWTGFHQETVNGQVLFASSKGIAFWMIVVFAYLLLLSGTWQLFQTLRGASGGVSPLYRQQTIIMLVGSAAPWIANILFISGLSPFGVLDLTPFAFTITGLMISYGLFRYSLLEIVPVAREAVLDNIHDGVLVLDKDFRLLTANSASMHLLNFAPEQKAITGKHLDEFLPGVLPQMQSALAGQDRPRLEITQGSGANEKFIEVLFSPFHDRLGRSIGWMAVLHDITDRKCYELEMEQARYTAENARELAEQANQAKSVFLAKMSRDLEAPLTQITSLSEALKETLAGSAPEKTLQQAEHINQAGHKIARTLGNILDISELETRQVTLDPRPFKISELVAELEKKARPAVEKNGNKLRVLYPMGDPGEMVADRARLSQVLLNILDNAAKFTKSGNILFTIQPEPEGSQARLQFEINDTGVGIRPQDIYLVFQPFRQTDGSHAHQPGGSGLGLAISKQLVEMMGGEILAQSSPNAGSTFTVLLPASPPLARPKSGPLSRT